MRHTEKVVKLSDVTVLDGNPRRHPEKQVAELRSSLEMFGQYRPLVLDPDGVVLAGNGMLLAMQALGWEEAQAVVYEDLTDSERAKLILADNRLAEMGTTDYDAVDRLLRELDDFEVPGYDADVIRDLLATTEDALAEAEEYGVLPPSEIEAVEREVTARAANGYDERAANSEAYDDIDLDPDDAATLGDPITTAAPSGSLPGSAPATPADPWPSAPVGTDGHPVYEEHPEGSGIVCRRCGRPW